MLSYINLLIINKKDNNMIVKSKKEKLIDKNEILNHNKQS